MRRARFLPVAALLSAGIVFWGAPASPAVAADPVVAAAGDYGCDPLDYNGDGSLNPNFCQQKVTANQLVAGNYSAVLALGDQHSCGSLAEYQQAYDPTWGRVKSITHPVPGNHEYMTSWSSPALGCNSTNAGAAGYFNYYGSRAGTKGQGWYSYDIGSWHLIALNSSCSRVGGCGQGSPQANWLAADLASHPNRCTLAYWHIPLSSSGGHVSTVVRYLWQLLYSAHADVVLNGHDHMYERFAPQDPNGVADSKGIRQFTVGTGGANHSSIAANPANIVVRDNTSYGLLALTLHAESYSWSFLPGWGSFTDSGSATCHSSGTTPPPTTSTGPTPTRTPTSTPTPTPAASSTPAPTGPRSITLSPIADSYVDASNPSANFGSSASIRVDASPIVRSYLRFNVSGLSGTVTSVTLRVYANSAQSSGYDVYAVNDAGWTETGITSANAPPPGSRLGGSGPVGAGTWTSATLTGALNGNGLVSFVLWTPGATALSLSSREGSKPPQLVITFS